MYEGGEGITSNLLRELRGIGDPIGVCHDSSFFVLNMILILILLLNSTILLMIKHPGLTLSNTNTVTVRY